MCMVFCISTYAIRYVYGICISTYAIRYVYGICISTHAIRYVHGLCTSTYATHHLQTLRKVQLGKIHPPQPVCVCVCVFVRKHTPKKTHISACIRTHKRVYKEI